MNPSDSKSHSLFCVVMALHLENREVEVLPTPPGNKASDSEHLPTLAGAQTGKVCYKALFHMDRPILCLRTKCLYKRELTVSAL